MLQGNSTKPLSSLIPTPSSEATRSAATPSIRCSRRRRSSDSSDGHFSFKGSTCAAILIGQAAVVLGLSSNSVLAQDDLVALAATSEQADVNVTGLRCIEDGLVISNDHSIKWRMCTNKAWEFFLQGKLDEAEKLFKAALQEAKEAFGLRDPHAASALNNLKIATEWEGLCRDLTSRLS
ncbi:uncharacterized protein [Aegilops tauschii subsp. strangulata]|uniref:Uncharacterized protein n=2 Tax=Aegilops tauschii subsp. strangulata TaxID=200361 RepID=A0A453KM39_AEGTS|nr:uncharacterized protein LOC109744886 isoform X2 [Aegilops tauschii subsp. strangulata]